MNDHNERDLDVLADSIRTRQDFSQFVRLLRDDLVRNPDHWDNDTLLSFLDAMSGWAADMEGAFLNQGRSVPEEPTWRLFAQMLRAAQIYE
jgi:hypothetical protein